jgi:copper transport protein
VIRALALALAVLALLPAMAGAHALLKSTTPERGARVDAAPEQVTLHFSEPVEAEFGAVRVFDSEGREVQTGGTIQRGGEVAVRLRDGLGEDGYTVTYRVISADSHPVSGGFVFVVGDAPAPSTTVGDLLGDDEAGPVTGTAFGVVRAVQFAAIALGLGAVIFTLLCWLPGLRATAGADAGWQAASTGYSARLRTVLLASAAAGAVSAALAIVLQGAVAGGTGIGEALDADVIGDVLGTRFGAFWALGFAAWLAVGVLAAAPRPVPVLRPAAVGATGLALPPTTRLAFLAVPLVALSALPALGGHAGVQSPVALLTPANVLHVIAMSGWLGGVAVLVLVLRTATGRLEGGERTRLLAAVVARFSTLAGVAIAALLASGIVQGLVEVRTVPNLVETAFGRAVLVKIVLFAGIVALGWVNRQRLLPELRRAADDGVPPGRAGLLLRRTLRAELLLGVAAIAVTGALAGYAPSVAEGQGPYSTSADIGPARLEMTVDPAGVGPNEMHVYLFDRQTGAQWDETLEMTVTVEMPDRGIAPIELEATKAGPGHFLISGATFGVKGDWRVEIASRVSDFDEFRTNVEVPVR